MGWHQGQRSFDIVVCLHKRCLRYKLVPQFDAIEECVCVFQDDYHCPSYICQGNESPKNTFNHTYSTHRSILICFNPSGLGGVGKYAWRALMYTPAININILKDIQNDCSREHWSHASKRALAACRKFYITRNPTRKTEQCCIYFSLHKRCIQTRSRRRTKQFVRTERRM